MNINVFEKGFVTDEVSTVAIFEANLNEENRIKFVTDLAAISRGKHESANPAKRYSMLLKEASPYLLSNNEEGSPSRPLEFLGVVLSYNFNCDKGKINLTTTNNTPLVKQESIIDLNLNCVTMTYFMNNIGRFSYMSGSRIYTNMRCLLNAGIPYDCVPYNTADEMIDFKAVRIKAPMFVFNHLITHTALSKEARSERVTALASNDYWLPADFREKVYDYRMLCTGEPDDNTTIDVIDKIFDKVESNQEDLNNLYIAARVLSMDNKDDVIEYLVGGMNNNRANLSQQTIQMFFKAIGYPAEIYQRAMLEFRYKEFIMTGWSNNTHTWEHLCVERNAMPEVWKNWTQSQTKEVVTAIKQIVFDSNSKLK